MSRVDKDKAWSKKEDERNDAFLILPPTVQTNCYCSFLIAHFLMAIIRKDQLEASLHKEKKLIEDGRLKDENPLDISENFSALCEACRRGDLKTCQEIVVNGVNINARDQFDYTPLILVIAPQCVRVAMFFPI